MTTFDIKGNRIQEGDIVVVALRVRRVGELSDTNPRNLEVEPIQLPEGHDPRDYAFTINSSGVTRA